MHIKKVSLLILFMLLSTFLVSCNKTNQEITTVTNETSLVKTESTYNYEIVNTDIYDWGVLLPEERYMKLDEMYELLSSNGVDKSLFPEYEDALLMIEEQLLSDINQTNIFDCLCKAIGVDPLEYH